MPLKVLGSVFTITKNKLVIVKLRDPKRLPPINAEVLDANRNLIGHVVDVIGPVEAPYAVVKPLRPSLLSLTSVSMVLFYRALTKARGS